MIGPILVAASASVDLAAARARTIGILRDACGVPAQCGRTSADRRLRERMLLVCPRLPFTERRVMDATLFETVQRKRSGDATFEPASSCESVNPN